MHFENWVPDLDAIERESDYLAEQYGEPVAARYRRIAITPPVAADTLGRRARKSPGRQESRLTRGQVLVIQSQYLDVGLSPERIARKWGFPVAAVRSVVGIGGQARMGA